MLLGDFFIAVNGQILNKLFNETSGHTRYSSCVINGATGYLKVIVEIVLRCSDDVSVNFIFFE